MYCLYIITYIVNMISFFNRSHNIIFANTEVKWGALVYIRLAEVVIALLDLN